jgi:hypothetical protein
MHVPVAMLHHWDMIQTKNWDMIQHKDDIDDNEIDSMPLLVTSSERFIQSKNLLQEAWNSRSGDGVEGLFSNKCNNHDVIDFARLLGWI